MKYEIKDEKEFSPIHLTIKIVSPYELIELVGLFGAGIAKTVDVLRNYEDKIDSTQLGQFSEVFEQLHKIAEQRDILHMNYSKGEK